MIVSTKSSKDSLTSCLAELHLNTPFFSSSDKQLDKSNCICPNNPCACFTAHKDLVEVLEKDLCTAAKVGKALLEDRMAMQQEMDELKRQLDYMNAENHGLLDHNDLLIEELAALNRELYAGDARLEQLTRELDETRALVARFNTKNTYTSALEQELETLDLVRENLQIELQSMSRDKKDAESRWRKSERYLDKLTLQYEELENQIDSHNMCQDQNDLLYKEAHSRTEGYIKDMVQDKIALEATVAELEKQLENYRKMETMEVKPTDKSLAFASPVESRLSSPDSDIGIISPPPSQPVSTKKDFEYTPIRNGSNSFKGTFDLHLPMTPESPITRVSKEWTPETLKNERKASHTLAEDLRISEVESENMRIMDIEEEGMRMSDIEEEDVGAPETLDEEVEIPKTTDKEDQISDTSSEHDKIADLSDDNKSPDILHDGRQSETSDDKASYTLNQDISISNNGSSLGDIISSDALDKDQSLNIAKSSWITASQSSHPPPQPRTTAFSRITSTSKDKIGSTSVALTNIDVFASVSPIVAVTSTQSGSISHAQSSSIGLLSAVANDFTATKTIETPISHESKKGWASSLLTRIKEGFERDDGLQDPVSGFGFQV